MGQNPLSIFFGNNAKTLTKVKTICSLKDFDKGITLISQDDTDNEVFLLLKGKVKAVVLSAEGHEIWLNDINSGEIFGEIAAICGFKRTSSIVAETKGTVAVFSAEDFLNLMSEHGSIGIKLSEILIKRIRSISRRMFELSVLSAPGRVYSELLRLSSPLSSEEKERRIIKPLPILSEMAKSVNSTRETVSRAINDLEKRGLIIRSEKALIIITPRKLSGLIS